MLAEPLLGKVLGDDRVEVLDRFPGAALEHTAYRRPFELVDIPGAHYVVLADYVTTEDGTGLVHQAPAFGAEDLAASRAYGLPVVNPIEPDGHFRADVPLVGGAFFKDADAALVADLRERGLLLRERAVRAHLPALLALPHRAALLRAAVLVHPDHRGQGPAAGGERAHRLVPGDDQARPVRRLAGQQRRLGAVPRPLLGHPAAGLALPGRPRHLRRLARRAG